MKKLIVIAALIIFIFKVLDLTNTKYNANDSPQIQPNTQKSIPLKTKETTIPVQQHETPKMKPKLKSMTKPKPIKQKRIKYKCDKRKYCSQMRSYEEAKYFLNHCRGVKMDGDHDGIPCERQFGRH